MSTNRTMTYINPDDDDLVKQRHSLAYKSFISEFSVLKDRSILYGRSQAKYFDDSCLNGDNHFNLNEGYETFIKKDSNEKLDILIKWILMQTPSRGLSVKKILHEADMVCWRGILTKIGCVPYLGDDVFRIAAVWYNNVIFLCELPTEVGLERQANASEYEIKASYWGHKFEQFVTMDDIDSMPNTKKPVDTNEEHCIVFKGTFQENKTSDLRKISIVYGAETDCILSSTGEYIELKTQYDTLNNSFWKFKAIKWYLQSYLVNIEKIAVGYRDKEGFVKKTGTTRTSEIGDSKSPAKFNRCVCLNYVHKVLAFVKKEFEIGTKDSFVILEKIKGRNYLEMVRWDDDTVKEDILNNAFREMFPKI
uniref:Decapping nuclease n=1 Tax=Rhabditophanes sp. KR3021 TaxID=114890 RepID=A0AC35TQL2_9BILA